MPLRAYCRPSSLEQALDRLAAGGWTVVAGCTDYYCRPDARPLADDVLDLVGNERKTGKSLGSDIEKQKLTLPLIRAPGSGR